MNAEQRAQQLANDWYWDGNDEENTERRKNLANKIAAAIEAAEQAQAQQLAALQRELEVAKSQAIQARAQAVTVSGERDQAVADARALAKRIDEIQSYWLDMTDDGGEWNKSNDVLEKHGAKYLTEQGAGT
jgi:16S rRNA G527 N7-methylase RsmG